MIDDDGHARMLEINLERRCKQNGIEYVSPPEGGSIGSSNARREKLNRQIRAAAKRKRIASMSQEKKKHYRELNAKAEQERIARLGRQDQLNKKAKAEQERIARLGRQDQLNKKAKEERENTASWSPGSAR